MKPNSTFLNLPLHFWADVRLISERVGYSKNGVVINPSLESILEKYNSLNFRTDHIYKNDNFTDYGQSITNYLDYRCVILNDEVEKLLMDKDEAAGIYSEMVKRLNPKCPLPLNKQKGEKAGPAFFTGIINMLIESNIGENPCNYDPHNLLVVSSQKRPIQVLSRRVDGAFPSVTNPVAIWEIKEYYNTTTFGSRAADGVYETQLDGMELQKLFEVSREKVLHYLMIDSHNTWWNDGKAYLCRIIDMLHMGYVDEVLFGREIFSRLPEVIPEWINKTEQSK